MTTVASIIQSALRETNLIPLGGTPTQMQLDEAFSLLSTIVAGVVGNEMGEQLNPFPLGQDNIMAPRGYPWWSNSLPAYMFLPVDMRIMCNLTAEGFVNLHPKPHDGARMGIVDVAGTFAENPLTIFGNGRSIEGESEMTYDTPGETRQWIYREDLGNWVVVTPLLELGDMPFPVEFDDMFIIKLAMRLNPRYGQVIHPASAEVLKEAQQKFSARYAQNTIQMPVENGLLYLTSEYRLIGRFMTREFGDSDGMFNAGIPF
jgi:hypothetical protein